MRAIPKGTDKESVYVRNAIIVSELIRLKGTGVPCSALGKDVEFVSDSIRETAVHASKNYYSTLAALRVVEAIGKAKYVKEDKPKQGKQTAMKFVKTHQLKTFLSGVGEVKMIVGERNNKRIFHYCITAKK